MTPQVAVVVSGFPRISETFALNELLALEERGMLAAIFATKGGDAAPWQPGASRLMARLRLLPPGTAAEQGDALADHIGAAAISAVHGYFAHTPAAVAERAAERLGVPFGFSVHARDARKIDAATLGARAHSARCVIACNRDVACDVSRAGGRAHLVPHGVDLERFLALPPSSVPPFRVLAVGRFVEKKGFDVLIDAIARLDGTCTLRFVGAGEGGASLLARAAARGIAHRVSLATGCTHEDLPAEYAAAHVIAVPSVVDATGDRDGLPNVVLEAMACGRPVVATPVGAVPSAVRDGETGLLVPPRSPGALAEALRALAAHPERCESMGRRGRRLVEREYDVRRCAGCFADLLKGAYV